jgi:hypothetical protein
MDVACNSYLAPKSTSLNGEKNKEEFLERIHLCSRNEYVCMYPFNSSHEVGTWVKPEGEYKTENELSEGITNLQI